MRKLHLTVWTALILLSVTFDGVSQEFIHPGIKNNLTELEFIKKKVLAGEEPWASAYKKMLSDKTSSLTHVPKPTDQLSAGSGASNKIGISEYRADATAAHSHALQWFITGREEHAKMVINICTGWGAKLKSISRGDGPLWAGFNSFPMIAGAEIVRHTYKGWSPSDIKIYEEMLSNVVWNAIKNGSGV
jgi:hypothetical protein